MGYYRASFGGGGGYTQKDIDSFYIKVDGVKYAPKNALFFNNNTFNAPINIGNNVAYMGWFCANCMNFNQPVYFGDNVRNVAYMFRYCYNFNQPVNLPQNVDNCIALFKDCRNLAQDIAVPDTIDNMFEMFSNCISYNGNIHISNNATQLLRAYANCVNIPPQSVVVPESVENSMEAFMGVKITDLYFKGKTYRPIVLNSMLGRSDAYGANVDTSVRHNIYFNVALNNRFNVNGYSSFISGANWTPMENGFYNATYNTYCYYNYEG